MSEVEIEILYQDENFVAVNKPSGVIVHPWSECADTTSLLYIVKEATGKWVYPVHRLDRPVSGVILFAFSSDAAKKLKEALESSLTQKIYISLCMHEIKKPICNTYELFNQTRTKKQEAKTSIIPIDSNQKVTLSKVRIYTGRYHQIRRHFSSMGNHLIGDTKYGKGNINRLFRQEYDLHRLFLHCIGLKLSVFGENYEFFVDTPGDLGSVIEKLGFKKVLKDDVFGDQFENLPTFSKRLS